ncbi:unnamed protein product [Caenorhabditis angaria]|uniref:Methanethiol oxidase n=1 Tax=Caenorhabditis angaria TaxID=860376 RepID=A0A9P1N614_9PELO|nr:unnamed protein product [Caenorhabditis angaria]
MVCGSKKCHGPGYASPKDALNGPREKVLFVTAPHAENGPDAIFSIDVEPSSKSFSEVISRVDLPNIGDEVHHTGWNACSSCHTDSSAKRSNLIVPCLNSDRIYILNVEDPTKIYLQKTIEPSELHEKNVSFPHTSHCLADGNIMISTLGNSNGEARGSFLLLDGTTFKVKETWSNQTTKFNYDFWYQPRQNVMISTEWGTPNLIKKGFNPQHVGEGSYGNSIHIFEWDSHKLLQSIELPLPLGALPLEVRFLHEPSKPNAFVGCALGSAIYHIHPGNGKEYVADLAAKIESRPVSGWALDEMPALITDILISMDDKYLYVSCWLHGDIRQYDISDPNNIHLTGQIYIGGSLHKNSGVTVLDNLPIPDPLIIKNHKIPGGPQMLQLSLDCRRLYVTTSLYKQWDSQFYPNLLENGACMVQVDIGEDGKMTVNSDFLVDFGKIEGGPYLAHEMRYPGGDSTSDIWI